jgi:DNA-binding response OmpR family regulator
MSAHTLPYSFVTGFLATNPKANTLVFKDEAPVKADAVRVFGVEDDSLLRMLLSTKFEMSSVTFDFSEDGAKVTERIREFKPTVILLDIMIGGVNGLDLLQEIKQTSDLQHIPVVMFSNQDSYEERARATTLGANEYLVKATTDLSDLVKLLARLSS